jgi:hypothetical protein
LPLVGLRRQILTACDPGYLEKPFQHNNLTIGLGLASDLASRALRGGLVLRIKENFMSLSVNSSNNPLALWQSMFQQGTSSSSGATQSDPLSELLAAIGQATGTTGSGTNSAATGAASSTGSTSSAPQFDPQTLQALFDLQANGPDSQSDANGATSSSDPGSTQQAGQGHHGHHHAGGKDSAFDMFATAASASSQTTPNSNGSSTTTITYADGSSVTLTTAAPSSDSSSSASTNSSAGSSNVAGNNFLEQLIQMQAQLSSSSTASQTIATV